MSGQRTRPSARAAEAAAALVEDACCRPRQRLDGEAPDRRALGRRVLAGLRIVGIPTSTETEALALTHGITLAEPGTETIDLAIDGADEVERGTLRLIKGLGGALLREKIVAESARRFVVVADASKVVAGPRRARAAAGRGGAVRPGRDGAAAGGAGRAPLLRRDAGGMPFVTTVAILIFDCAGFAPIRDPFTLQRELRAIAGVVESGLFLECAEQAIIGAADGSVGVMRRT